MKKYIMVVAMAVMLPFFGTASAEYPDKPVTFVVPFPPGDLEDVTTRWIAEAFQAEYGIAAAVVNKPGGGGGPFPGAMEVANAPADGSMVGSFVIGVPVVGPYIGIEGLNEDTFEPIGIFLTYPFVIATSGDAPYSTMQELAAYAKDHKVALGHFGAPLVPTKVTLAVAKELGFSWGSDAAFDMLDCNTLASGDVDVINTTLQLILACLDDVKVLASVTEDRIALTPDAPTVGEIVPSLKISLWNGLFVTKGTSQEVKDKLEAVAKRVMLGEKAQALTQQTGGAFYWRDAAASAAQIKDNVATMAKINAMLAD